MKIKHILFLISVVIIWYIYLNKSISIETFNIGIPMRDEPNELFDCGNPFNTTIGDNTMEFNKANQLSDPLLLADNTYLFNGDNMLDPIHSNIDSSHGTELSVKCDQGDPDYRYSPYSSANRVQFRQLDDSALEQIATITCNAPIGLPDAVMNIPRRESPRRREELPDAVIGTNLRTCVISGCHSSFIEIVGYELSLPLRMSIYSYENEGLCFTWSPKYGDLRRFIYFLLSIPNKYYAYLLYLQYLTPEGRQTHISISGGLDEIRETYGKPIHIKRYQNLLLKYGVDFNPLWQYIFLLRNIKHYTNICGSMGQDLMRVDHRVVTEGTLTMYTSSVEIQNYTPIEETLYDTIWEDIEEGKGRASGGESVNPGVAPLMLGFTGYFVFGGDYNKNNDPFKYLGPWFTYLSMVYFNRHYETSDHRFRDENLTIIFNDGNSITESCRNLIKDYLLSRIELSGLFTFRFEPIAGGSKANYNFRIPAENYHLLRRIIQQLIISTCVSIDKRKLRIGRMDSAMVNRLFRGDNQTVKLPIFCFSTYLFNFFKNYSEGAPQFDEVYPYTEYAIDETAGPYTSEDIRYVMEEIVDQIITKDGPYYEVYKNILINMGIQDPDVWITEYVSKTRMLERRFRCFQDPHEPPISRPFLGSEDPVTKDPIHWLTHLWECWGFSDIDNNNNPYYIHDLNADALLLLLQLFKQDDFKGLHIHTLTCMINPRNVTPQKEASMNYEWEYRYNVDDSGNAVDKIGPTCEKLSCDEETLRADLSKRPEYEFVDDTLAVYRQGDVVPRYRKTVYTHKDVDPEGGAQSSGRKELLVTEEPLAATPVLVKCKGEYENQDPQEIVCKYNWDDIQDSRYPGLSTTKGEVDFKREIAELPDCMLSDRLTTAPLAIEASQSTNTCAARSPKCEPVITTGVGVRGGEGIRFLFKC